MTTPSSGSSHSALRLLGGIAVIVAISLAIFYAWMRPPMSDLGHMAQFLAVTALISGLVGYVAYRFGWLERSPSLRWTLLGGYALASLLTFFNVWITARLMFASEHDLLLGTVLLFFATGIAMVLGSFISNAITGRLSRLDGAARELQAGNLSVQVPVAGSDEIADLARAFNQAAARLEQAEIHQRELELLRRDLIAWAGHDLRTPLTSVRLLVEALADGMIRDPGTSQRYLEQARKQIDQLAALIDDLFEVSQLDAGGMPLHLEQASLSDLISDTLESFSELAARHGVNLSGGTPPEASPIRMDIQRIGRVLNNLVGNALRHTPRGGSVTVESAVCPGWLRVTVSDTGEGISADDLPHVFDRFYKSADSRGTGLGLTIARNLVLAHGGEISAASEAGKGTTMRFRLPLTIR